MSDLMPIPPTSAVADPQVRAVLDALAHNQRSGALATKSDVTEAAQQAVTQAFGGGTPASSSALGNIAQAVASSRLFQDLRSRIEQLWPIGRRVEQAEAGIKSETETRQRKDFALASAINTIWAAVGGSAAVIEDGQLAEANPGSATATKWDQVVAAVTDPDTGQVNAASIKQEFLTYATNVDSELGSLNAQYVLKVDVNGYVSGFGLASSDTSSTFIINADKFALAKPGTTTTVLPFTVDSGGNAVFAGKLSAASGSFAGSLLAATGTFSGSLSAATGTFAGTLTATAVDAVATINIAGESVVVPRSASASSFVLMPQPLYPAVVLLTTAPLTLSSAAGSAPIAVFFSVSYDPFQSTDESGESGYGQPTFYIYRKWAGGEALLWSGMLAPSPSPTACVNLIVPDAPGAGTWTYELRGHGTDNPTYGGTPAYARSMLVLGAKR